MAGRSRKREKGAELVEFALVFPLFLALIFALIWCGRTFSIYGTITRAAREGARFAVAPSCASCTPANTVPTDTEVVNVITGAVQVAGMNMNALRTYSPPHAMTFCTGVPTGCNTTSKVQICRGVQLNNTAPRTVFVYRDAAAPSP